MCHSKKHNMKKLKTEFTKLGFKFNQLKRNGDVCLFERVDKNGIITYEVIRVIIRKPTEIMGRKVDGGEGYPGNERWGSHGWTFTSIERANSKYHTLINELKALNRGITPLTP